MSAVLQLQGVGKAYGQGSAKLRVLADVNITVEQGEYLAVIGPSGSGKSTLLNILGCLDIPSDGRYLVEGKDVATLDDRALSHLRNRRIGFIFQSFQLVSHLTVLENVELPMFYARKPRAERRERARELLEKVGLKERLHHRPAQLSGGERQRTAVARALSNQPALLLADEPTGNLDSTTGREIMDLFHRLHDLGATLVLITHDPGIAAEAPRRVALRDGRVESDSGRPHAPVAVTVAEPVA
jgi:putative ABC transport system ATP-binding protein